MVAAIKATGQFKVLTDGKYLTSDKNLMAGDILVCVGHHTAMVLENGPEANCKKKVEVAKEVYLRTKKKKGCDLNRNPLILK